MLNQVRLRIENKEVSNQEEGFVLIGEAALQDEGIGRSIDIQEEWSGEVIEVKGGLTNAHLSLTITVGGRQKLLFVGKIDPCSPQTLVVELTGSEVLQVELLCARRNGA